MLKRNNVWEYCEGLLQACISSTLLKAEKMTSHQFDRWKQVPTIYTREKRQRSGFKSGCHRRVSGHLTDLKNMDAYQEWKKKHVRKLKNCFTHYDAKHFFNFF